MENHLAQDTVLTIAVLGGTGKEGSGLALRWADAGYAVIIGSRDEARAKAAAVHINTRLQHPDLVSGMTNTDAARACGIAVLTVPYSAHRPTLDSVKAYLQGKILVDVTVPINPDSPRKVHLPAGGSAGVEAQALLGDDVRVVSAFQNVGFSHLQELEHAVDCDVLVTGNDRDAKQQVIVLAQAIDMTAFDAGPIENAVVAEALTSALININVRFKVKSSGIRITGIPR